MSLCAISSQIYISSGPDIEKYDPISNVFTKLPVLFTNKLLSAIVNYEESLLIFRGGEVHQLDLTPSPIMFRTAVVENIDLWSTTAPILQSNKIYFIQDNTRLVYCFDIIEKTLQLIADLNHHEEAFS